MSIKGDLAKLPCQKIGFWREEMSKTCQVTGKKPVKGKTYSIRGIAKKKKGIGLNITGVSKRRFQPNLFKKRFWHPELNCFISLRLSAAAIRTIEKRGILAVLKDMKDKKSIK